MYRWLHKIQNWAIAYPKICALLWLIFTIVMCAGLPRMELNANYRAFFKADDPLVLSLDKNRAEYESGDAMSMMIATDGPDIFSKQGLIAIEEMTAAAWTMPYVLRVDSLGNFPWSRSVDDDLFVSELIEDPENLSDAQRAEIRDVAMNEEALIDRLLARDGQATLVMISFTGETSNDLEVNKEIYQAVLAMRDDFRQRYPELQFHATGTVAGNAAFAGAAERDGSVLVPLALLCALTAMLFYLWYESGRFAAALSGTSISLAIIIVATVLPLGVMAWFGVAANNITSMVPIVILTLAVADSLHILISYYQYRRRGENNTDAIRQSLRLNTEPVWLTSITTMFGFLALNASDAPPFQQFGNLVALGVFGAWFASNTLLPALIALTQPKVGEASNRFDRWMPLLADWVIARNRSLLIIGCVIVVAGIACIPMNRINEVWTGYLSDQTEFSKDTDQLLERFGEVAHIEFSLDSGRDGGIVDLEYLEKVEAFSNWLRAQPEITYVQSVDLMMKRLNRNLHGDDPNFQRLPENEGAAAQYLLMYEMSLPFGASLTDEMTFNKSESRVVAGFHRSETLLQLDVQERAQAWLQENAPELWHPGTSMTTIIAHMTRNNAISMLVGTIIAILVIATTLAIAFRSVGYGILSMVVNSIPATIVMGAWGLIMTDFGISVTIVFTTSLGIVVDYSVHFLSKYRRFRNDHPGTGAPEAIRYAFGTVGIALLVTTAVLGLNFGLLYFSEFRLNIYVGVLTATTIVLALMCQLFFLPSLLLNLSKISKSERKRDELAQTDA